MDELGVRVNGPDITVHPGEIAESLNAAGSGTGTESNEVFTFCSHFLNPVSFVRGGNGALDNAHIIRTRFHRASSFEKIRNIHGGSQIEQLVFQVQDGKLATIARRKFVNSHLRLQAGLWRKSH
jgi:hypothetical protein